MINVHLYFILNKQRLSEVKRCQIALLNVMKLMNVRAGSQPNSSASALSRAFHLLSFKPFVFEELRSSRFTNLSSGDNDNCFNESESVKLRYATKGSMLLLKSS